MVVVVVVGEAVVVVSDKDLNFLPLLSFGSTDVCKVLDMAVEEEDMVVVDMAVEDMVAVEEDMVAVDITAVCSFSTQSYI